MKIQTVREMRDYARFLGIKGIWGKKKVDLENHILDSINNAVEDRFHLKPNKGYDKAYLEALLDLRSKKLTQEKTWNHLMQQAPADFRKRRRTTKEDVEREITKGRAQELTKKYRKNIVKKETLKNIIENEAKMLEQSLNGAYQSYQIAGRSLTDIDSHIKGVKSHINRLITKKVHELGPAKIPLTLWIKWTILYSVL